MNDNLQNPLTRAGLERLSTDELVRVADSYGIDIPEGLERIFIIEEILESANSMLDISKESDLVVNPDYPETAPLPKQYNVTYMDVIIRDPLWVFVFWEIKGQEREIHENKPNFNGYCLRVIPVNEGETEQQAKDKSFTVLINPQDSARYIGFASFAGETGLTDNSGRFVIHLSALYGNSEKHVVSSHIFKLPKLYTDEILSDMNNNKLASLSGVMDLTITKKTDRQPKGKRS